MAETTLICHRCGRIFNADTKRRTGLTVFDEHARDKFICMDCQEEMEEKPWSPNV